MIESFIFNSENDNIYIHDDQNRLSMLVHPAFVKAYEKSTDAQPYYLKKYAYLKNHGFFAKSEYANFETVEDAMIQESIVHTQQIMFEIVDYCNLNCTYCGFGELYEGYDVRTGKKMDIHNAITLLKYIFQHKPKNRKTRLSIGFYGGEPLLNIDFIKQIVKVVNQLNVEKGFEISFSMTTNATLVHKYIDFLVENKFKLHFSLDGDEKGQSYRVFAKTNKNSFQKVIENIDMVQRDYPNYFSECVNFIAVLHNRNSAKVIYDFIYTRYRKIPMIGEINLNDIKPEKKSLLEGMFQSISQSESELQNEPLNIQSIVHDNLSLFKELSNFLKYYSVNFYVSNIICSMFNREKYIPSSTCMPFSKKIYLTIQNKLLPCEKINYDYAIGNVNENVEINIPKITRKYNYYYNHLKKFCQSCYAYRFCGICIYQIKNIENCDSEEFVCDYFSDQKAFNKKLSRTFSFLEKYPNDFSEIIENVVIE